MTCVIQITIVFTISVSSAITTSAHCLLRRPRPTTQNTYLLAVRLSFCTSCAALLALAEAEVVILCVQVRNSFGFHDHNPPPLDLMGAFCKDVEAFLAADPQNVVGVHCLAGKGRSGVMVCAYLLHSRLFSTALQARGYFDEMRMRNGKGVTVPSQVQYVGYYERVLQYQRDGYVVPLGRNALTIEILSLELRDFVPRDIAALEAAEVHCPLF